MGYTSYAHYIIDDPHLTTMAVWPYLVGMLSAMVTATALYIIKRRAKREMFLQFYFIFFATALVLVSSFLFLQAFGKSFETHYNK